MGKQKQKFKESPVLSLRWKDFASVSKTSRDDFSLHKTSENRSKEKGAGRPGSLLEKRKLLDRTKE